MKYLMFADTWSGEYQQVFNACDDDEALKLMDAFLRTKGLSGNKVYSVAGVWNRSPLFYTATQMKHLYELSD